MIRYTMIKCANTGGPMELTAYTLKFLIVGGIAGIVLLLTINYTLNNIDYIDITK